MSSTTISPPSPPPYPYPSTVNISNFISVKLTGHNNYHIWKTQFLCLIQGHDMSGFIDNTFPPPLQEPEENMRSWKRSDSLLRGWILSSLTEDILTKTITLNTAKDVWSFLEDSYSTLTLESAHARSVSMSESEDVSVLNDDDHWKFDSGHVMMKRFSTPHSRSLPVPLRGVSQQIDLKGDSVTSGVDGRMSGRSIKLLRGLEESYSLELDEISDFLHEPSMNTSAYLPLYKAALRGHWDNAQYIIDKMKKQPQLISTNTALLLFTLQLGLESKALNLSRN